MKELMVKREGKTVRIVVFGVKAKRIVDIAEKLLEQGFEIIQMYDYTATKPEQDLSAMSVSLDGYGAERKLQEKELIRIVKKELK